VDLAVAGLHRLPRGDRRVVPDPTPSPPTRRSIVDDDDVYVIQPADLPQMRGWHVPARVVLDATRNEPLPGHVLAQVVVLRRRLKAAGGELIVAAGPETARGLCRNGVHWAVPCHEDLSVALDAARQHNGGGRAIRAERRP
jgi:hypothetical protein